MSEGSTAPGTPSTEQPAAGASTPADLRLPAPTDPTPKPTGRHRQGNIVSHTYVDPYLGAGGEEVTVTGIVIGTDGDSVEVAWLDRVAVLAAGDVEPVTG